jgi:hypothetical protein
MESEFGKPTETPKWSLIHVRRSVLIHSFWFLIQALLPLLCFPKVLYLSNTAWCSSASIACSVTKPRKIEGSTKKVKRVYNSISEGNFSSHYDWLSKLNRSPAPRGLEKSQGAAHLLRVRWVTVAGANDNERTPSITMHQPAIAQFQTFSVKPGPQITRKITCQRAYDFNPLIVDV